MSLADEFGQWKQSQPIQQTPIQQAPVVQEETPFWERAKNDLVSTVSNYLEGGQQGINELSRAQDAQYGNDLAQITSEQGYQPPTAQQQQYVADAQKAVMNETVLPTLALNPGTAFPAIGTMLMGGAKDTYENTEGDTLDKAGNAVRAITYGPAIDMYNDPELSQRFYDRPITTLTEGALVAGQALLPVVGAKRGIAKAGEFKTDLARMVDEKINGITDNAPYKDMAINGLDALDQIDSPTRGFRPATPDEAIQYNAEQRSNQGQNLVQALEQLKQQKFDQTEGVVPELRFPERQQQQSLMNVLDQLKTQKFDSQERIINQQRFPQVEQQQALLQALERAKQQKFDEANQQSYNGFMKRQQAESEALQARKNEIASSVLFSPLDRMQVGADLPIKRSLGGQGKVFGENVTPSMLELPKPKQDIPQRAIEQPKKIPDAFDLVNQVQTKLFDQRLKDAVNKRDYPLAEQLADRMTKEGFETPLSKSVQSQKNGNRLYAGFDPTFGKYDNLSIGDIGNKAFEKVAEKMWNSEETVKKIPAFSEHKQWFSGLNEKVKEKISASDGKSKGRELAREVFEPLVVDRFYSEGKIPAVGARYGDAPASGRSFNTATGLHEKGVSMMQVNDLPGVNSFAVASARDARGLKYYIGEATTNLGGDNEVLMNNTKPITKKQYDAFVNSAEGKMSSYAISFWKTDKMAQMGYSKMYPEIYKRWDDIYNLKENELSGLIEPKKNKLQSGFDPTGGRFDNVDLGAKAKEVAVKSKNRIVNGLQDDRIIDNGRKWYEKGIKDLPPIKKVLQRVYQEVFDSLDPISRYDKEVYKSARLANGTAVGRAESMIRNKNNVDSFENITKPIHDRIDDFAEYMVAKRAKELHATGTMTGVSNEKIAKILSEAPPEFAEVQKQLSSYSDRLVEMLVDSGMISEEHAINMFNKYESYAPMMQAFDGEQISRMFQDKGDLGKPIKNIEGSDSKVINPIESILKNTYTFNMIAETNKVRQQIASLAETFPDEIKILKNGEAAEKGTGTFDFFVDGKKHTMQLEPRLFEAIASMDSQQTSIVVKVLSKPASWLRAGATLSPEFLVKNLIRDTIGAGIVGKDFTPFVDSYKGLKSAWKKDQDYWDYKEAGGATGHLTGLDRNHLQEALDNYRAKSNVQKLSTAFNPKTWLEVLRKGQEISEDATKLGYYKKRISKGDSVKEATFEARDLLDFSRSGNYTREANKVAAFLNASLQGTDKLVRSFKNRPLETATNVMKYLIMPSMAVWYLQSKSDKKDEIQNLPKYVRDMFWVIPAGDKLIRIPKPFEPGVLFATGTERTLDAMFSDKRTPYKGYGDSLWEVTFPNLLPTGLLPLGEWWANKSFFTGQSIVPQKEQDLPDEMQYDAYTTNTAKFAGKVTGQSPRKIDNAIRGLTGGAGTAVTSIIDSVTGGNTSRPSQTLSDMPVVKAFVADPRKGQQSTQDFYDELDKYTKSKRAESVRGVKMTPNEKRNYEQLNNANTALKALNKEERKIIESNKLSADEKRKKLDKIIDAQTKLVQASLKRLK